MVYLSYGHLHFGSTPRVAGPARTAASPSFFFFGAATPRTPCVAAARASARALGAVRWKGVRGWVIGDAASPVTQPSRRPLTMLDTSTVRLILPPPPPPCVGVSGRNTRPVRQQQDSSEATFTGQRTWSVRNGHLPWGETKTGTGRTRAGRGPHDTIQRNGCGPDADRTRAVPFLSVLLGLGCW
eukprot:gene18011-biopygen14451